jgi:hypothetical protein
MKYKTLEELRDAYQRDDRIGPLVIGTDTANVWEVVRGQALFSQPVAGLLEEALDLLGIRHRPGIGY